MKTATQTIRPALLLGLIAGLTLSAGMLPLASVAQDSQRTIATGSGIPLTENAPDEYVVKRGDTLWDISKVFLREPWYWPEIWYVNPQVQNPHLIYPGDKLKLVYIEGQPRVTLAERGAEGGAGVKRLSPSVHRDPLSQAITAIPYEVVAGFAQRPQLLTKEQVDGAPYIVAMRDDHAIAGVGNDVYAKGLKDPVLENRYSVIHVESQVRDPETKDVLGYTGTYVGAGSVTGTDTPTKLTLVSNEREALQGDKLFPESVDVVTDFVPRSPAGAVDATVIAVRGITVAGQYHVVALNRGVESGLEPGHVLAIEQKGGSVIDKYAKGGLSGRKGTLGSGSKVKLPSERVGVVMVFKAYDRISYALVMETTREIREGDHAKNP